MDVLQLVLQLVALVDQLHVLSVIVDVEDVVGTRVDGVRRTASGIGSGYRASHFFTRQGVKRRIVLHLHILIREKDAAVRELAAVQVNRSFLGDRGARSRDSQNGKAKTYVDRPTHLTIVLAENTSSDEVVNSFLVPRQSRGLASGRLGKVSRRRGWPCVAPCIRPA